MLAFYSFYRAILTSPQYLMDQFPTLPMAAPRLALHVSPIAGRNYTTLASQGHFLDAPENELDPQSKPFAFHASFRGCCYNALTKILLVCDPVACCVRTFDVEIRSDTEIRVLPRGQIGERGSTAGKFLCPVAVDVSARGELAVADYKLNRIAFFTGSGSALHYFGKTGSSRGEFRGVMDLKFTALGHIAIVDSENHRVQVMTTTGGLVMIFGRQGSARGELSMPCAVDIGRNGDLCVCDSGNKRIQRFSAKGKWLAMWGSKRYKGYTQPLAPVASPRYDANGLPIVQSMWKSVFETPCDVLVGINGEILVCDVGRQDILVFNDAGSSLHVIHLPKKPKWSPVAFCIVRNSLVVAIRATSSPILCSTIPPAVQETACDHRFLLFPPPERVVVGKLTLWPMATLLSMISYLTYTDAVQIRLVNRRLHWCCRVLRNEWRLFPLIPGHVAITKYNRVVHKATGRVAVTECFAKWGLRIFKPANRIRKHVMDFDSGFRNAISSLFGSMFFYQHEELLRDIFAFYAASKDKQEIHEAGFVEIVTQIEEIRAGFLTWRQCPGLSQHEHIPAIRTAPREGSNQSEQPPQQPSVVHQLKLVENAQQQQLNKLLGKLRVV